MTRWKWRTRAYYWKNVPAPKMPGELAIETLHANDTFKDVELKILFARDDIGRIEIDRLRD